MLKKGVNDMKRSKSHWQIASLVVCLTIGFVQTGTAQEAMVVNMSAGPSTLDPAWGCSLEDQGFIQNFYVRLTQYGKKDGPADTKMFDITNPEPYLAKSWEISEDKKVYTFNLRDDFYFENGVAIDSNAVKYSLERTIEVNGCGKYWIVDGFLDPPLIKSIETPDPLTVIISLTHPNSNFLLNMAMPPASILNPDVVEANGGIISGQPNEYLSSNVAGAGPFLLESYMPNQRAVLVANPLFPGPGPNSDKIIVNFIQSPSTLLLQARTGEADVTMGLSKLAISQLERDPTVRVVAYPVVNVQQIILPNDRTPWDNLKVREAVSYAVPYQLILDRVAYGYGTLFFGALSPTMTEFNALESLPREYDLERAKRLMAESGLNTPVDVTMVIQEGDVVQQQVATIVQSSWQELGINVEIQVAPPAEYLDLAWSFKLQTLMRLDGPAHGLGPGYFLGYDMLCPSAFNLSRICIPEADELLFAARGASNPQKAQSLYDEINRLWIANTPKIPLFEEKQAIVLGRNVTNFFFNPLIDFRHWASD